jgi:hypothetical protein
MKISVIIECLFLEIGARVQSAPDVYSTSLIDPTDVEFVCLFDITVMVYIYSSSG